MGVSRVFVCVVRGCVSFFLLFSCCVVLTPFCCVASLFALCCCVGVSRVLICCVENCSCCGSWPEIVDTEDKFKSRSETKLSSCCYAYEGSVGKSKCDGKCNGKHVRFPEASADMIEQMGTLLPWSNLITKFSRRVRMHEVADGEHNFERSVDIRAVKPRCLWHGGRDEI